MVRYITSTQPSLDAALYNVKKLVAEKEKPRLKAMKEGFQWCGT